MKKSLLLKLPSFLLGVSVVVLPLESAVNNSSRKRTYQSSNTTNGPQCKRQRPNLGSRQQIVDLFRSNVNLPQKANIGKAAWDKMIEAIENGDFATVENLMPSFGSSSAETRSGKTLLQIAEHHLKQNQNPANFNQQQIPPANGIRMLHPAIQNGPEWKDLSTVRHLCNLIITPIRFYHPNQDGWGEYFGNFSAHGVVIDAELFHTVEHYFQAQKIRLAAGKNPDYDRVVASTDPDKAKTIARNYYTKQWDTEKYGYMEKALIAKVQQHQEVRYALLSTNDAPLYEQTTTDLDWGIGTDGSGENNLGRLWMKVRIMAQRRQI